MKPTRICLPRMLQAALPLILLVGCGEESSTFPAGGTVKSADGTPLVGVFVGFQLEGDNKAPSAKGTTGPDGAFTLGTYEIGDGALPGQHKVMIAAPPAVVIDDWESKSPKELKQLQAAAPKRPQIDVRYRSYATSGLSYTVTENAEKNYFDIVVDTK